jgi:hypothetical protein
MTSPSGEHRLELPEDAPSGVLETARAEVIPLLTRPKTRGECVDGPRPCPWASCRHHLVYAGARAHRSFPFGDDLDAMAETCALDAADRGAHTCDAVAALTGQSMQRVQQLEHEALSKLRLPILEEYRGHESEPEGDLT